MYDICQSLDEDWSTIKQIITAKQQQPIGDSHLDPILDYIAGLAANVYQRTLKHWEYSQRILGVNMRFDAMMIMKN